MSYYKYLIIGGGMAADAAAKQIREFDKNSEIAIISADVDPPYKRPPLSKSLWKGKEESSIWLNTQNLGVTLHLGCSVKSLDVVGKRVLGNKGEEYTFEKLLIATGGTPRRLTFDNEGIIYYRTAQDYRKLRELTLTGDKFVVIGGGFIGWEVAAALAMNKMNVTMVFPETVIGSRIYPKELGQFLNDYYAGKGVEVISGDVPTAISSQGNNIIVSTSGGRKLSANGIVAGLGITPNVELAQSAEIAVDNGIVVDSFLQTGSPDIFAAGDVASFYNPALGKHIRVEHEDNAITMGAMAGKAMTGNGEAYTHLPFFYSDLFELGYEAVGSVDTRLETFVDWKQPFEEGVIYYLENERVRGVLLWNVWEKVDEARALISESGPFSHSDLKGRIHA